MLGANLLLAWLATVNGMLLWMLRFRYTSARECFAATSGFRSLAPLPGPSPPSSHLHRATSTIASVVSADVA
ncbi:uncharacterized protein BJ171DRAFT_132847 [Polychytrium aggregatum]|uniref:uncharacterized protein n=1 Tax=Polychytrium aggregatum TaxID=110093 RepID=UPI0022FEA285|nr:uncharacterized protein BJ171DRAFT_132847 [Polychytrium aggregatum]KAI9203778.1 hypothetical protein BJ171DRAFT_132847 [Polychytrium aggregatum]